MENNKISFFNEYESYTKEVLAFTSGLEKAIEPFVQEYLEKGYPTRELESLCVETIIAYLADMRLRNALKKVIKKSDKDV